MLSSWCVYFEDGKGISVLAKDKAHVRTMYKGVKSVFKMNRKFVADEKRVDDLS